MATEQYIRLLRSAAVFVENPLSSYHTVENGVERQMTADEALEYERTNPTAEQFIAMWETIDVRNGLDGCTISTTADLIDKESDE